AGEDAVRTAAALGVVTEQPAAGRVHRDAADVLVVRPREVVELQQAFLLGVGVVGDEVVVGRGVEPRGARVKRERVAVERDPAEAARGGFPDADAFPALAGYPRAGGVEGHARDLMPGRGVEDQHAAPRHRSTSHTTTLPVSLPAAASVPSGENA